MSFLKKIQEDIFKSAEPKDLTKRKKDRAKMEVCPGCKKSLREVGIIAYAKADVKYDVTWEAYGDDEWGEGYDGYDVQSTWDAEYYCGECATLLVNGRNFIL